MKPSQTVMGTPPLVAAASRHIRRPPYVTRDVLSRILATIPRPLQARNSTEFQLAQQSLTAMPPAPPAAPAPRRNACCSNRPGRPLHGTRSFRPNCRRQTPYRGRRHSGSGILGGVATVRVVEPATVVTPGSHSPRCEGRHAVKCGAGAGGWRAARMAGIRLSGGLFRPPADSLMTVDSGDSRAVTVRVAISAHHEAERILARTPPSVIRRWPCRLYQTRR